MASSSPPPPYVPVPVEPRQRRSRTVVVVGMLFALVLLLVAGAVVASRWNAIGQAVGPSCTIGVTGTAANVTVQGWGANADCQTMLGASTYQMRSGPQGVEVCQYDIHGNLVTVRDEGLVKLVGAAVCARLESQNPPAR